MIRLFAMAVVIRHIRFRAWLALKPTTTFRLFLLFVFLVAVSCQDDETPPPVEEDLGYFPLKSGNMWTYTGEEIEEDGHVSYTNTERWNVSDDLFLQIFNVTPTGEEYQGYRALYLDGLEIRDIMGTVISTKYINLPTDSLVFVASDNYNFLRERWIKGGLVELNTSFGDLQCICTKTTYHYENVQQDEYHYFCKNIGVYLVEKHSIYVDLGGNSFVGSTWRQTLTDYEVQ